MNATFDPAKFINLRDFESAALERLPEAAREYLASGSADEITLGRNRAAFEALRLMPRVLRDVSRLDTSVRLFGEVHALPLMVAPTGYHRMFHDEGERATARGAAAAGVAFVVSTMATVSIEDLSDSGAMLWFQLYTQRNEEHTLRLVERAEAAGCRVLVVTVDTPVLGARDRERRLVFPTGDVTRAVHLEVLDPTGTQRHHWDPNSIYSPLLNPELTWDHIERIRANTRLPLVLKGLLSPADARRAADVGVDGVIVSNHGGRNLDTVPATIEVLPDIVRAVDGRIPVLLDGGVRRGTDVLKALALGAHAVMVGRPALWGLAVGGADGVARMFEILRFEFQTAMALAGAAALRDITPELIWRGRVTPEAS